jgi:hypothetical protein
MSAEKTVDPVSASYAGRLKTALVDYRNMIK